MDWGYNNPSFETCFGEIEHICWQETIFFEESLYHINIFFFLKNFKGSSLFFNYFLSVWEAEVINFHLRLFLLKWIEDFLKFLTFGTFLSKSSVKMFLGGRMKVFESITRMLYVNLISASRIFIWASNDLRTICFILILLE